MLVYRTYDKIIAGKQVKNHNRAKYLSRFHLAMMGVWTIAVIPTLLWWRESILWIAFLSLYGIWVGHFSAYDAARAEMSQQDLQHN